MVVHIGVIIYAVRGGLSGAEILARTRGNWGFAVFYTIFVLACAVHVPIGVANIAEEWFGWTNRSARLLFFAAGLLILVLGLRAVVGVTFA